MNLSRGYLLALVIVFAVLSLLLVLPFVQYVLGAILLTYVLSPLHRRLETRIDERVSALAMLVLAFVGFALPFVLVIRAVVDSANNLLTGSDSEPTSLAELESLVEEYLGVQVDIAEAVGGSAQEIGMTLLSETPNVFQTLVHAVVGLGVAFFLIYYFLKDGDRFMAWLHETTPLPDPVQDDLYDEIDGVMRAVLLGHVFIAIVQGIVAGFGLFATGIPNATFWTFMMIVLAILPLIGAFLVWGPAAVYLVTTGQVIPGVALFVYGTIVVGLTDDYLRPIVVERSGANLSPAIIILGVLGGAYAFGVMGLFFGPVVLGALKATLSVVSEHYDRLEESPGRR